MVGCIAGPAAAVTDAAGTTVTSAPVLVNVQTNRPPQVSISFASGQVFPFNTPLSIPVIADDYENRLGDINLWDGINMIAASGGQATNLFQWQSREPGVHVLYATVQDEQGLKAQSAPVSITILSNVLPVVGMTSPDPNTTVDGTNLIHLEATATSADGNIDRVVYYHDGIYIGSSTYTPYAFDWTPDAPLTRGGYQLYAMAYDNYGDWTQSEPVQVLVGVDLPAVTLTSPSNGSTVSASANVTINVHVSGAAGAITNYTYFTNGVFLASLFTNTYVWQHPPSGNYAISVRTRDTLGVTGYSPTNQITVGNGSPTPPTVTWQSPVSGTYNYNQKSNLQAVPSDATTPVSSLVVGYYDNNTFIGTAGPGANFTLNNYLPAVGSHTIRACTTNAAGLSAYADLSIVMLSNRPPVVSLTGPVDGTVLPVGNATLSARASDPDGDAVTVTFYVDQTAATARSSGSGIFTTTYNLAAGNHTFFATASSAGNAVQYSATNHITAQDSTQSTNHPPTYTSIDFNGDNALFTQSQTITLRLQGVSDPDQGDAVATVDFYANGQKVATLAGPDQTVTQQMAAPPLTPGSYVYYAVLTDGQGATTTTTSIKANVNAGGPTIAFVNPTNGSTLAPGTNVPVSVSVTTSSFTDQIRSLVFYVNGVTTATPTATSWTWQTPTTTANYTLSAVVTDSNGLQATNTIQVNVQTVEVWLPMTWARLVNVAISGENVVCNVSGLSWDAYGISSSSISTNGAIRCSTTPSLDTTDRVIFGLTTTGNIISYSQVNFGLVLGSNTGVYYVIESGLPKTANAALNQGDMFEIEVLNSHVSYYVISHVTGAKKLIYTSSDPVTLPCHPVSFLRYLGNICFNPVIRP